MESNLILPNNAIAMQNAQRAVLQRDKAWSDILITNQKGKVINNDGALHYDDYKDLTRDTIEARRFDNVGIQDLISRGLTTQTSISKTLVQYETKNQNDAEISMNASNRTENKSNYKVNWVPLPIYHSDFTIPWRQEGFSYKESDGVSESVYAVNSLMDKVLFMGADLGIVVGQTPAPLYGYTNHPATIPATISDWADPTNISLITNEAVGLVGLNFINGKVMAPDSCIMYVATDIWSNLQADYNENKGDRTVYERLKAISEIADVKPQKDLPAGAVCLVEMRPRTVQLAVAQLPVSVPWVKSHRLEDGRFTIYSSLVAKIKADRKNQTGIVYATKS